MSLCKLDDRQLHSQLKSLVSNERELLTSILRHLREVERRRLHSDFGCSSLFEYATTQLGYSEAEAFRRIQAMRVLRELPEFEKKVSSGQLSLTNISQAQSLFRKLEKKSENKPLDRREKIKVLSGLEDKTSRQAQRQIQTYLDKHLPGEVMKADREKSLSHDKIEVSMVMSESTREKLDQVRSLLGPEGAAMN